MNIYCSACLSGQPKSNRDGNLISNFRHPWNALNHSNLSTSRGHFSEFSAKTVTLHFTASGGRYSIASMASFYTSTLRRRALSFLLLSLLGSGLSSAPIWRVSSVPVDGATLLQNPGLEVLKDQKPVDWVPWQSGFRTAPGEGRDGSMAAVCQRLVDSEQYGLSQNLLLNHTNIRPLLLTAWSKAERVSGNSDSGYALYADLIYADGTPLWAQNIGFDCGTHGWQKRELLLLPDRPIRSLTIYGLFRGHNGKVWFDDFSARELDLPPGTVMVQGVPAAPTIAPAPPRTARGSHRLHADGIKLAIKSGDVVNFQLGDLPPPRGVFVGFMARDFAANSDFYAFTNGVCSELGLRLESTYTAKLSHIEVTARLTDLKGKDRAVTLLFALPVDATGWQWGDDVRKERPIQDRVEYASTIRVSCGADGKMSRYPLGAIWNAAHGLALGMDMAQPAQYRIVYHAGLKEFFIAYDLGLSRNSRASLGTAEVKFAMYHFDARWGFRAALQRYYDIYPGQFTRRVQREGTWMPFTDIATIPGFEDFGFAFQEGAPNVRFDDEHHISSFVYVEPASHWLPLPASVPRTEDAAMEILRQDLQGARGQEKKDMAAATLTSVIQDVSGRNYLYLVRAPWCDGGMFTLNPDPAVAVTPEHPLNKAMTMQRAVAAAFEKNQSSIKPAPPAAGLDGVYLDSFEMAASQLNYRRDHFRTNGPPLVFDRQGRPCQLMIFNSWKFAAEIARQMHSRQKLTFANAVLSEFAFPAPLFDVLGIEVNWCPGGNYQPDSDETMNFRRALCRQKPYCLLMNTDFAPFTSERVELYFQRCLLYGIWPGFFDAEAAGKDPYWTSSRRWYERDRPLFRKYIPLLRRLTEAGWEPITGARCNNPSLLIERFGPNPQGEVFWAVLNDSAQPQDGVLELRREDWPATRYRTGSWLPADDNVSTGARNWPVRLLPQQASVLRLQSEPGSVRLVPK